MLICTVRECRQPLVRELRTLRCSRGHSFDVAASGYINLLQPQDKRARQPGDSTEAISARRRLHDRGVTAGLRTAIANAIQATAHDVVLDAGCGEGFYLGTLQRELGLDAHGVDISTGAIDSAARRYPACEWVVANADRQVPYADQSFSLVLSITARMNSPEFRRVLRPDGRLLIAIPSQDDLVELRGVGVDRVARTVATFADHFRLSDQRRVAVTADLDTASVHDVLTSIYRPMPLEKVEPKRVTFGLDLLLFHPSS